MKYLLFLCLAFSISSYADWNQEYEEQTKKISTLKSLRTTHFKEETEKLSKLKRRVLSDEKLIKRISLLGIREKYNYLSRSDFVLKKRKRDKIRDSFIWELSSILNASQYVVPSTALAIGNNKAVVQLWRDFKVGYDSFANLPNSIVENVSLENYWKSLILAYILGISDLTAKNIGVSADSIIFFDIEFVKKYLHPRKDRSSIKIPFIAACFDWPQYREPINSSLARKLKKYTSSFLDKKEDITSYCQIRELSKLGFPNLAELISQRIEIVNNFEFSEGSAFVDFYKHLFPEIAEGLDELNQIVSKYIENVDHGRAIFYTKRILTHRALYPKEDVLFLNNWRIKYIK